MFHPHYSSNDEPFTRSARWAARFGIFALAVVAITIGILRSGAAAPEHAQTALLAGALWALLALVFGISALVVIWKKGWRGTKAALLGMASGCLALAFPVWFFSQQIALPPLYDMTTDVGNPPVFQAALLERTANDLDAAAYNQAAAMLQLSAYPDVQGVDLDLAADETFAVVRELVASRKWRILASTAPEHTQDGILEVNLRNPVLGIESDAVIRIQPQNTGSRIDMRAASRKWRHDMGFNAQIIAAFMSDLQQKARE